MKSKTCDCPNCGTTIDDLGTLTLICWECGHQFVPHDSYDDEDDMDYDR